MKRDVVYLNDFVKDEIVSFVDQALGDKRASITNKDIVMPPEENFGDFALPCFIFAKTLKKDPLVTAKVLANKISRELVSRIIKRVEPRGAYLNFFVASKVFSERALEEIQRYKDDYGKHLKKQSEKTLMFEFSQPNTHKEFHVGHLRGTILGQALVNLYKNAGFKIIPVNYLGDVGAHIAKILWALTKFHKNEKPKGDAGKYLGKIYAETVKKLEENPKLKNEVSQVQQKLESGDKGLVALWKKTRKWSLDEFNAIYKELGIKFKQNYFESEMEKPGKGLVKELLKKGIAKKSEGAIIADLKKYNLDILVILKTDQTSLYATKDLALAKKKARDYKFGKSIIQTDVRQSLYFKQLFKMLELMGFKTGLSHLIYEMVTLPEGTMSSRSGNIVSYDELKNKLLEHAKKETKKRHQNWTAQKINKTAQALTLAVIKFEMVKQDPNKIITFNIKKALSFDGFTAPYLLYTIARINSILKKEGEISKKVNIELLNKPEEITLIKTLAKYPDKTKESLEQRNPAILVHYLYNLAKTFTSFYHAHKVLGAEKKELKQARLLLITSVKQILENGLAVLGIEPVKEM